MVPNKKYQTITSFVSYLKQFRVQLSSIHLDSNYFETKC